METFSHVSVLLKESIDLLDIKPGGVYVDGTLGFGGHSLSIAERGGSVIGIDRDEEAITAAKSRLKGHEAKFINDNFKNIKAI